MADRCCACGEAKLSAWTPIASPVTVLTTGNSHERLCGACGALERAYLKG